MKTLTANEAEQIAHKLNADLEERRGHRIAYVRWQGKIIATYGIRRGSKELGHDYIPRQIFITMREAFDLARCPLSRDEYFNRLRMRGKLPIEEPPKPAQQKLAPKKPR
jgi:hypothetical protein